MSRETIEWLNTNVLIGFTDKRGTAWHYKASAQGEEPNHYPGAIPVGDVKRRLFNWRPIEVTPTLTFVKDQEWDEETQTASRSAMVINDTTHKAIVHPVTNEVFQYASAKYQLHHYDEWLLDTVSQILDSDLSIGSAGLLEGGGLAWVQVEMPETITTPEGVKHRPWLAATTAHNGSTATTYKKGTTDIVCDNTRTAFFMNKGESLRVKHTANSVGRLAEVRDALAIVHTAGDEFNAYVKELCEQDVTERQWGRFLTEQYAPEFPHFTDREKTFVTKRREQLDDLYHFDNRVSPWQGTAYGVVQAVNTYVHHHQTVRGRSRAERNMLMTLRGDFDRVDNTALSMLEAVTA